MTINGQQVTIIPDTFLPVLRYEQVRRHRKPRINKKWLKRYGAKPVYDHNVSYIVDVGAGRKEILVSKKVYEKLKEALGNERTDW